MCSDPYGGQDSLLHLLHFRFHSVFKDRHEVDEVLYDNGSVEVLLGEARVLRGCSFVIQELTEADRRGGFGHCYIARACTGDGATVKGSGRCEGG